MRRVFAGRGRRLPVLLAVLGCLAGALWATPSGAQTSLSFQASSFNFDRAYGPDQPRHSIVVPELTGGSGTGYEYVVTPTPVPGLTFDFYSFDVPNREVIFDTSITHQFLRDDLEFVLTGRDSDGAIPPALTFYISFVPALEFDFTGYTVSGPGVNDSYNLPLFFESQAQISFTLPPLTGGFEPYRYIFYYAPQAGDPAGLSFGITGPENNIFSAFSPAPIAQQRFVIVNALDARQAVLRAINVQVTFGRPAPQFETDIAVPPATAAEAYNFVGDCLDPDTGSGEITYDIFPESEIPDGLRRGNVEFGGCNRATLAGTPQLGTEGTYTLTYRATDSYPFRPRSVLAPFTLIVHPTSLVFDPPRVSDQTFFTNRTNLLELPTVVGDTGNIVYELLGNLNGLLFFDANNSTGTPPRLIGKPVTATSTTELTYTAARDGVVVNSLNFELTADGICERTLKVQQELLNKLGAIDNDCDAVTLADLGGITGTLSLQEKSIDRLRPGDFAGLSRITNLSLSRNRLVTLPEGVFNDLRSLTLLGLGSNRLISLPANVFDSLRRLQILNFVDNRLTTLPAGIFDNLDSIIVLSIGNGDGNQYSTLPTGLLNPIMDTLLRIQVEDNRPFPLTAQMSVAGAAEHYVNEGQNHVVRIDISSPVAPFAVAVPYTVSFGGAAGPRDFRSPEDDSNCAAAANGQFLIAAGQSSAELTFCVAEDGVEELDSETFTITLSNNSVPANNAGRRGSAALVSDPVQSPKLSVLTTDPARNTVTLSLRAAGTPPQFHSSAIGHQTFLVDVFKSLTLPRASGGDGRLSYSLDYVPRGLSLVTSVNPTQLRGSLSGNDISVGRTITFTVTDSNDASSSQDFLFSAGFLIGVCSRTQQIQDAIVAALGGSIDCSAVRESHLAGITSLAMGSQGITTLQMGDFAGLVGLTFLGLGGNSLGALSPDIFSSSLPNLREIRINHNDYTELPPGLFRRLGQLRTIRMDNGSRANRLTSLPANMFAGLDKLENLNIGGHQLETLPAGIFKDLRNLQNLSLGSNQLTSLPDGVFDNLHSITSLAIGGASNILGDVPTGVFGSVLDTLTFIGVSEILGVGQAPRFPLTAQVRLAGAASRAFNEGQSHAIVIDLLPAAPLFPVSVPYTLSFGGGASAADFTVPDDPNCAVPENGVFLIAAGDSSAEITFCAAAGAAAVDKTLTLAIGAATPVANNGVLAAADVASALATITTHPSRNSVELSLNAAFTPPGFFPMTVEDKTFVTNVETTFFLPFASGGTGGLAYFLKGDLSGFELNRNVRPPVLFGSPAPAAAAIKLSYLVIDELGATASLTFNALVNGVCERTEAVRDTIVDALSSVSDCSMVSFADLNSITDLSFAGPTTITLQPGDFSGLVELTSLILDDLGLETTQLPREIFDGLNKLETLVLSNNDFVLFFSRMFRDLGALTRLHLDGNRLGATGVVGGGIFDNLRSLEFLRLDGNEITDLSQGIFDRLDSLTNLWLGGANNIFASLPARAFDSILDTLSLLEITNSPYFPVAAELSVVGAADRNINEGQRHVVTVNMSPGPRPFAVELSYDVSLGGGASASDFATTASSNCAAAEAGFVRFPSGRTNVELTFCAVMGSAGTVGKTLTLTFDANPSPSGDNGTPFHADVAPNLAALSTDSARNSVVLSVAAADAPLIFNPATLDDQTFVAGQAITTIALPLASGGTGILNYSLNGDRNGLNFNPNSKPPTLSGAPNALTAPTALTYIATDSAGATASLTFNFTVSGICGRTIQVQTALLTETGVSTCEAVTSADLAGVTSLNLTDLTIGALRVGDFGSLDALTSLDLNTNNLTGLPTGIFSGLGALTMLDLSENNIGGLLHNVFNSLGELTRLDLSGNNLRTLEPALFNSLAKLENLFLHDNRLTELPARIFDNLAVLVELSLGGAENTLTNLPPGLLIPLLDTLTTLDVSESTRLPLSAEVGLAEKPARGIAEGQDHVVSILLSEAPELFAVALSFTADFGGGASADDFRSPTGDDSHCTGHINGSITFPLGQVLTELTFCFIDDATTETGENLSFTLGTPVPADNAGVRAPAAFPTAQAVTLTNSASNNSVVLWMVDPLVFTPATVANYSYTVGAPIEDLSLPVAMGGTGAATYSLNRALAGLTFRGDTDPPTLVGTPQEDAEGAYTIIYTATHLVDGDVPVRAGLTFNITVAPALLLSQGELSYTADFSLDELTISTTLVQATGGVPSLTYSLAAPSGGISPNIVPPGLVFEPETRRLSGTPADPVSTTVYSPVYMVTDSNGAEFALTFGITINPPINLQSGTQFVDQDGRYQPLGLPFNPPLNLPDRISGGTGPFTRSLTGPGFGGGLAGLIFDEENRTLSGLLSGTGGRYEWKVSDSTGAFVTLIFRVIGSGPVFDDAVEAQVWRQGDDITALLLPEAMPGNPGETGATPIDYRLSRVPVGLNFNGESRLLFGAPSTAGNMVITYIARDSQSPPVEALLTIATEVVPVLTFRTHGVRAFNNFEPRVRFALELPEAGAGSHDVIYDLAGEESVDWLDYSGDSASAGVIRGTIPGSGQGVTLTFSATDIPTAAVAAQTIELTFTIAFFGPVFSDTVEAQIWRQNEPISSLVLPVATPGNPDVAGATPISYRLDGVPAGLNFNQNTRLLSGMPGVAGDLTLTFVAVDNQAVPVESELLISVSVLPDLTFHAHSIEDTHKYTVGAAIALTLPQAGGGEGALIYDLTGEESQTWLTYTAESDPVTTGYAGILSGAIESLGQGAMLSFTVTDTPVAGTAKTISLAFRIVSDSPIFTDAIEDQVWRQDEEITPLTLSAAEPNNPSAPGATPITYQLSNVPAGLTFNAGTRVLVGTPTADGSSEMTYTATDSQSPPVASERIIAVMVAPDLTFHTHGILAVHDYDPGETLSLTLPQASGEGAVVYDLSGEESHSWLTYNGDSGNPGTLSGTVEARGQIAMLAFSATDTPTAAPAKTIRLVFRITSNGPVFVSVTEDQVWRQPGAIVPLTLPLATPGDPNVLGATPISYQLDGEPAGLTFDENTRVLSGTPGTAGSMNMTYTATDSQSPAVASQQVIAATVLSELTFHAHQIQADQNYNVGDTFALTLPEATGGEGAISYGLGGEESLSWLAYNGNSATPGILSGTIDNGGLGVSLTFSATDTPAVAGAETIRLVFRITSGGPVFVSVTESQMWRQRESITPLTLPEATARDPSAAGATTISYQLNGVPTGLGFNVNTRVLSGAPSGSGAMEMTYIATDGQSPPVMSRQVIALTVLSELTFQAHGVQENQNYNPGEAIALTLPQAEGGEGAISYGLGGEDLYDWLTYSGDSGTPGVLSGAIETRGQNALLTFSATDTPAALITKTIRLVFRITSSGPVFVGNIGSQAWRQFEAITPLTMPTATPGDQDAPGATDIRYQLSGVPAGLRYNRTTRVLSGAPSEAGNLVMTFTATDGQSDPITSQQDIAVVIVPDLSFQAHSIQTSHNYVPNEAFALTLPQAVGGEGGITHALAGLESWLSWSPESNPVAAGYAGILSGVLADRLQTAVLTFSATDTPLTVPAKVIELRFRIGGSGPYFDQQFDGDEITNRVHLHRNAQAHEDDQAAGYPELAAAALPEATRNAATVATAGPLTYRIVDAGGRFVQGSPGAVAPYAAPGLRFNSGTRVLSGAPQQMGSDELTYRVNDGNGDTAELYFDVRVVAPRYFRYTLGEVIAVRNVALRTVSPADGREEERLSLPPSDGGVLGAENRLTDDAGRGVAGSPGAVAPYAAPGLTFSPDTGVLQGTPTVLGETNLVYVVEDPIAPPTRLEFTLRVVGTPLFISQFPDIGYISGEGEVDVTLPEVYGAIGTVRYRLTTDPAGVSDSLPSGLTFDAGERRLFGTPLTQSPSGAGGRIRAARIAGIGVRALDAGLTYIARAGNGEASLNFRLYAKGAGENEPPLFNTGHRLYRCAGVPSVCFIPLTLGPENAPVFFDPSPYFTDGNAGDRHIYDAVSDNEDIVRVSRSPTNPGGLLTLSLRIAGESADLTVTATDPHGENVSGIFRITIRQHADRVGRYAAANEELLPVIARAIADQNVSAITRRISQATAGRRDISTYSLAGESDPERIAVMQAKAFSEDDFDFKGLLTRSSFVMPMPRKRAGAGVSLAAGKNTAFAPALTQGAGGAAGVLEPPSSDASSDDASVDIEGEELEQLGLGDTLVFWGSGDQRHLSGQSSPGSVINDWDAEVYGVHFGADFLVRPNLLAGLSVSWNRSEMDYNGVASNGSDLVDGEHDLELITVSPYLAWELGSFNLWAVVGYGEGSLDITEDGGFRDTGDAEMRTMAMGAVSPMMQTRGGFAFRFKGEAQKATLRIKDTGEGVAAVEADASRLRMTIEAGRPHAFLSPRLDVGFRYDDGSDSANDDNGDALELGFSVDYSNPGSDLRTTGRIYTLIGRGNYDEWGIQGHITLTPANTNGLSLTLSPGYGTTRDGFEQIWRERTDVSDDVFDATPSLKARFSYAISRGRTVLTPHTEFSFGDRKRTWRTGLSWDLDDLFDLTLIGERHRDAGEDASNSVLLQGKLHF